jgi:hypothetical protein
MSEIQTVDQGKTFLERLRERLDLSKASQVDVLKAPQGLLVRHSQFVYCNTGGWAKRKPWAAKITGYDPKYKFAREFLDRETIDGVTYQYLPQLPAIVQFHGGSTKNEYKPYYYMFERDGAVFAVEVSETLLLETLAEN